MAALPQAPTDLRLNQRLAALHTRAERFAEAGVCCRTLQSVYSEAGYPEEATRYGELADRYQERSDVPALTDSVVDDVPQRNQLSKKIFRRSCRSAPWPAAAPWPAEDPNSPRQDQNTPPSANQNKQFRTTRARTRVSGSQYRPSTARRRSSVRGRGNRSVLRVGRLPHRSKPTHPPKPQTRSPMPSAPTTYPLPRRRPTTEKPPKPSKKSASTSSMACPSKPPPHLKNFKLSPATKHLVGDPSRN